ncbi:MAG: SAM-dependent methyltransferase [Syntrophus sp. (in: bacteria)]|nr:SAM-dependent methyltransferase [Syntrophus sp. (in: bacteria)]
MQILNKLLNKLRAPDEVVNFNARTRNAWVADKASKLKQGVKVLDAGAGECQYAPLFRHCDYKTQDFSQYAGTPSGILTEGWKYGKIDYVCDILSIPVPDESFDVVLCTEVLEHVPRPIETIKELSRVLAGGGTLLLTAPLSSAIHQQPYHYYGGYSPFFYKKFLPEFGLDITEIKPIGGLMKHVAQELSRVGRVLEERAPIKLSLFLRYALMCRIPKYLAKIDDEIFVEEFTVGYMIEAKKRSK